MSEQQSSPPEIRAFAGMTSQEEATVMAPSAGAGVDEAELSDEDLEHVVGGLARASLVPGEQSPSEDDDSAGAHVVLNI